VQQPFTAEQIGPRPAGVGRVGDHGQRPSCRTRCPSRRRRPAPSAPATPRLGWRAMAPRSGAQIAGSGPGSAVDLAVELGPVCAARTGADQLRLVQIGELGVKKHIVAPGLGIAARPVVAAVPSAAAAHRREAAGASPSPRSACATSPSTIGKPARRNARSACMLRSGGRSTKVSTPRLASAARRRRVAVPRSRSQPRRTAVSASHRSISTVACSSRIGP
jgi:hypothetical protein